jgi:hypothetical protein
MEKQNKGGSVSVSKEIKKAKFEAEDKVRPLIGSYAGQLGIVKEINDMILNTHSEPSYKVRFEIQSQFGYSDYDYRWYQERELSPNVLSPMGFHMEESRENRNAS